MSISDEIVVMRYEWCKTKGKDSKLTVLCPDSSGFQVLKGNDCIYQTKSVDCLLAFLLGYEHRNSKILVR